MFARPVFASLCVLMVLCCGASHSVSQVMMPVPQGYGPPPSCLFGGGTPGYYWSAGVRKYINSFTSYQFPNPFPPGQDPLSRLEFPIDQWFAGGEVRYVTPYWSLSGLIWTNFNTESNLNMQDSDWDDASMPGQKTIFSESKCRLNRGLLAEVRLALPGPKSACSIIRPVVGARYQQFRFTTHDGVQTELGGGAQDLPGDGIDFRQTFYHAYLGGLFGAVFQGGCFSATPPLMLDVQFDYALVTASNEDVHLLRAGDRVTNENTRGHAWHCSVSASIPVRCNLMARVEADFIRILTEGSHRMTNSLFNIDFSFDGAKVWSDQASVTAMAEWRF